jgi:V-type H+-transporting ATPase subunit E
LIEAEVYIKCRKSDEALVQSVIDQAVKEYQALMKKEVKMFKGKEPPCKVVIDTSRYLPEYDENEAVTSTMGGVVLHCRKGRIVCSNTFDDRLSLCYQEAIPDIRRILFPSFLKKE